MLSTLRVAVLALSSLGSLAVLPWVWAQCVPEAEVCDGMDNDCDTFVDEGAVDATTWFADADSDGFGTPGDSVDACVAPEGYVADNTDCDDTEATSNPLASEICDGEDNDCDTVVDEGLGGTTWFEDADSDGFGNAGSSLEACAAPPGYVADNTDCDDTEAASNPLASEICDTKDNDCDSFVDEGLAIDPELCNGDDDDCDTVVDEGLEACFHPLDIDGNGEVKALTDILLLLRWAFGFMDPALTEEALGDGCTRCDGPTIIDYIEQELLLTPPPPPPP